MEIRNFEEFALLAECEDYSEVAEYLYISESTLARHIRMMEFELGVSLFNRTQKGISLNSNGKEFLPYAKEVCKLWEECLSELGKKKIQEEHMISVTCGYNLVNYLTSFHRIDKDVIFSILYEHNEKDVLMKKLSNGEADFIITDWEDEIPDSVEAILIKQYEYGVLAEQGHPLYNSSMMDWKDLGEERFIETTNRELETDPILLEAFKKHQIVPNIVKITKTTHELMREIEAGTGITFRRIKDEDYSEKIKVIELTDPLMIKVYFCYLKERKLRPIESKFIDYIKQLDV